jgi:pimeloyl-ACP methyl ester carboxylesterase
MPPSILLLPGNMCDGRLWQGGNGALLRAVESLGWPVYCPVLDAGSVPTMARSVLDAHDGRLVPIGFSMGGIVALEMARQAPERLIGLGLLDTNASADLPERAAQRPRQQAAARNGRLEEIVTTELKPNYLAAANRADMALLGLLRDMALSLGTDVFVRQSEALRTRPDLSGVLSELAVPVFIACGSEDRLCPPEWHVELARQASEAQLHVVEHAGHMLPLEQPQQLADRLLSWLRHVKEITGD